MLGLLVDLLVFCLIAGLIYWLIGFIPSEGPFRRIAQVVFVVICVIVMIYFLVGLVGGLGALGHPHRIVIR